MNNAKPFQSFVNTQKNFRDKWIEFYTMADNFSDLHFVEELTPLFGTAEFEHLSKSERHRFFLEYIKFVAETLVLFEQILVFGAWNLLKKNKVKNKETSVALNQFAKEELYHSNGFRHFLSSHQCFNWSEQKIFADAKVLRKIVCTIISISPAAIFLPGVKLEAFTLSYYKMIKKHYPDNRNNSWIHINHIHQLDEALHVPLEFDLHNSIIDDAGPIRTIIGELLFIIAMQFTLLLGSYKVVKYSFPHYGFFKKCLWTIKLAKWAVRTTPAYQEARMITKKQFQIKKPKYGNLLSFVYW